MGHFSIKDLESLSGIKAHTIRMWEQRYGVLRPVRTATNIRTYCDSDLRRLLNVATLCERGQRISQVASLSEQELCSAVAACCDDPHQHNPQITALLMATLDMDERRFSCTLTQAAQELGFEATVLNIIYPFLYRVGVLWQTGSLNPAQEHMASHLLRQKLLAASDALGPSDEDEAPRWVLFLPAGELHELALLFMNYLLRARGHHVLYLGQNLPVEELASICQCYQPQHIATVLTTVPERDRLQTFVDELARLCPAIDFVLYGPLVHQPELQLPTRFVRLQRMTDFIQLAEQLRVAVVR
ncbi:MerR family transcriptional regulator [Hymenobacter busanensis]|uniref:MerR family transcriptional regulator n=1 Tax=Hymenobacter busanensis TaxID=2607656 RepID=A0A7L4ZVT8_9BACT|nr:MerR family transcriptional regulator [Hymenobacter busanensis]KAA9339091.1 MerR family transcriptional regulator [Hymenobacter busanensis]QHJ07147.1 MerR family transcriptional regulator [Hymenobacter busanensis]